MHDTRGRLHVTYLEKSSFRQLFRCECHAFDLEDLQRIQLKPAELAKRFAVLNTHAYLVVWAWGARVNACGAVIAGQDLSP